MSDHQNPPPFRLLALGITCVLLLAAAPAQAADGGSMDPQSMREEDEVAEDRVPTGARRAAAWEPSPEGAAGEPWLLSFSAGLAFFSGDDAFEDQPGFFLGVRATRDLANDFYFAGAYQIAFARTEVPDPDGGTDRDSHVLHVPTVGVGFRAEVTPEIRLFVEPRLGAVITGDDVGPAGGASLGVDFQLDPGLAVRVGLTGLFTDATVDTSAGDADLNGIWSAGVGLVVEF